MSTLYQVLGLGWVDTKSGEEGVSSTLVKQNGTKQLYLAQQENGTKQLYLTQQV
jgi:hypothetical protein